jgi:hypothetical protein
MGDPNAPEGIEIQMPRTVSQRMKKNIARTVCHIKLALSRGKRRKDVDGMETT